MIGIPVFMDAKTLQVFIDEDLRHGSKKRKPARGGLSEDKNYEDRRVSYLITCLCLGFYRVFQGRVSSV